MAGLRKRKSNAQMTWPKCTKKLLMLHSLMALLEFMPHNLSLQPGAFSLALKNYCPFTTTFKQLKPILSKTESLFQRMKNKHSQMNSKSSEMRNQLIVTLENLKCDLFKMRSQLSRLKVTFFHLQIRFQTRKNSNKVSLSTKMSMILSPVVSIQLFKKLSKTQIIQALKRL